MEDYRIAKVYFLGESNEVLGWLRHREICQGRQDGLARLEEGTRGSNYRLKCMSRLPCYTASDCRQGL